MISDQIIHNEYTEIEITNAKDHNDVRLFSMFKSEILYFPLGIDKCFPDLTALIITDSKLRKITAENLKGFPHVTYLDLSSNNLVMLEANLFKFNTKLEEVHLKQNIISFIDPSVLDNLKNLKMMDLSDNKNCYPGLKVISGNAELIMQKIQNSCSCPQLQSIIQELSETNRHYSLNYPSLKLKLMLVTLLFVAVTITLHVALCMILYRKPSGTKSNMNPSNGYNSNNYITQSQTGIKQHFVHDQINKLNRGNLYSENVNYEEISANVSGDYYSEVNLIKEANDEKMSRLEEPTYAVV